MHIPRSALTTLTVLKRPWCAHAWVSAWMSMDRTPVRNPKTAVPARGAIPVLATVSRAQPCVSLAAQPGSAMERAHAALRTKRAALTRGCVFPSRQAVVIAAWLA